MWNSFRSFSSVTFIYLAPVSTTRLPPLSTHRTCSDGSWSLRRTGGRWGPLRLSTCRLLTVRECYLEYLGPSSSGVLGMSVNPTVSLDESIHRLSLEVGLRRWQTCTSSWQTSPRVGPWGQRVPKSTKKSSEIGLPLVVRTCLIPPRRVHYLGQTRLTRDRR